MSLSLCSLPWLRIRAKCRSNLYFGYKITSCTHLSRFCPSSNKLLHLILSWAISSWRRARRKQHWRSQFIALPWRCIIIRWMLMSTVALCIQDLHFGFWCTDWTNSIFLDGIHLYTNGDKPAVFQNTTWYAENKHIFKTFGKSCLQSIRSYIDRAILNAISRKPYLELHIQCLDLICFLKVLCHVMGWVCIGNT